MAIAKCWDTACKTGEKMKERIHRVGNKNKHSSTLEHLNYSFDIDGISRACLQELARHRHASLSVKSTRYTLKELKDAGELYTYDYAGHEHPTAKYYEYCVPVDEEVDAINALMLEAIQVQLNEGKSNDVIKFMLPEAYMTSLVWTVNARSLQNFLALRTNKAALWEIRDLAYKIYANVPDDHKFLFEEFIYEEK